MQRSDLYKEQTMSIGSIINKIKLSDNKVRYATFAAAAIPALAAGFMLFGKEESRAEMLKAEEPLAVSVFTVEPRTVDAVLSASGALSSRNTSVLSSKIMGRVVYLGVNEGDYVARGRLLMKIESGEITAQALSAQAAYNNARLHYDRIKTLYIENASTQMEMDQATLGLETAEAGLKAAKAMESYTTITAPIPGQIVEKRINLGEMALPGQPVLKIEDNRDLRLEVTVREQDVLAVRPGMTVKVHIDAMPGKELTGRVSQVTPASDIRTHSFNVKIAVPAEKGLITGMYGKASFPTGRREAVLVPSGTLADMAGLTGVYLVTPEGRAIFQMVQPGESFGDQVEIIAGLKPGDRIVAERHEGGIDGRKVVLAENE